MAKLILTCLLLFFIPFFLLLLLLLCNGDVQSNQESKKSKEPSLSCCHWNANSLLAHDCVEVNSLEAYNSVFNMTLFVSVKRTLTQLFLVTVIILIFQGII